MNADPRESPALRHSRSDSVVLIPNSLLIRKNLSEILKLGALNLFVT
jgi:hypothetical protein